jgi:hypothetical protein
MPQRLLNWAKQARGIEFAQQAGSHYTLRLRAMMPRQFRGQFNSLSGVRPHVMLADAGYGDVRKFLL